MSVTEQSKREESNKTWSFKVQGKNLVFILRAMESNQKDFSW